VRQFLYDCLDKPLGWSFYVIELLGFLLVTLYFYGVNPSHMVAEMVRGLLVFGVVCTGRRLLVGHWR